MLSFSRCICFVSFFLFFFFNNTAPPEIYPLPLPAPLPISGFSSSASGGGLFQEAFYGVFAFHQRQREGRVADCAGLLRESFEPERAFFVGNVGPVVSEASGVRVGEVFSVVLEGFYRSHVRVGHDAPVVTVFREFMREVFKGFFNARRFFPVCPALSR